MRIVNKMGYSDPQLTAQRLVFCAAAVTLASVLGKAIIPSSNFRASLLFSSAAGTVGTLMWENRHLDTLVGNLQENKVYANVMWFVVFVSVPLMTAKALTGCFVHKVSYKGALGRGIFLAGAGTAIAYGSESLRTRRGNG